MKIQRKKIAWGLVLGLGSGSRGVRVDVNGELFVKIKKKTVGGVRVDVECERRIEVFGKLKKKWGGGGSWGLGVKVWGGGGQGR